MEGEPVWGSGKAKGKGSVRSWGLWGVTALFLRGFSSLLWWGLLFFKSKHWSTGGWRVLYKCEFHSPLSAISWGAGESQFPSREQYENVGMNEHHGEIQHLWGSALPALVSTAVGTARQGHIPGMALCPWSSPSPGVGQIHGTACGSERGWHSGFDLEKGPLESNTAATSPCHLQTSLQILIN